MNFEAVVATMGSMNAELRRDEKITLKKLLTCTEAQKVYLRAYYGLLIQKLVAQRNFGLICRLLVHITDSSCVFQHRVDRLLHLYRVNARPELERLLRAMRSVAPNHIYFPPTGQLSLYQAQIPRNVLQKTANGDLDVMSVVYSCVSVELQNANNKGVESILAQLLPLAIQSRTVLPPIQEFVYQHLGQWQAENSTCLKLVAKYAKYWPESKLSLIIDAVAPHYIHDLWWSDYSQGQSPPTIAGYLRFKLKGETPSPQWLEEFIFRCPVGLFLCHEWAESTPRIKAILQGESEFDHQELLSLANNPWLGNVSAIAFTEMAGKPGPRHLTEDILHQAGLQVDEFCFEILRRLESMRVPIENYLV